MTTFWTRRRTNAALLVAQDQQSDVAIAAAVGVTKSTLEEWKLRPEFAERVQEHVQAFAAAIKEKGIAERVNRVAALNDRWRSLHQVIEERAADETMTAAGARTGLLVRTYKQGKMRLAEEYAVDTGLLAELRQHEKQAAQELGQWTEKRELTGKDGAPMQQSGVLEIRYVNDWRSVSSDGPGGPEGE